LQITAVLSGIERVRKEGEAAITSVETQAVAEVSKVAIKYAEDIKTVNTAVTEAIRHNVDELAKLQEERGKLESWVRPARTLIGMIQSPEVLKTISPALAIALLQNLAIWCDLKFPNADVAAMYDNVAKEFQQYEFSSLRYRISALPKFAAEAIQKQTAKCLKEESK
jgi:hypothetical protein